MNKKHLAKNSYQLNILTSKCYHKIYQLPTVNVRQIHGGKSLQNGKE